MENCLLTRLIGTTGNNTLPEVNTLFLDLKSANDRSTESGAFAVLLVGVQGEEKSVKVTSLYQFHVGSTGATGVTEYTITNNVARLYFVISELPEQAVPECIKITGDIYNIIALSAYSDYRKGDIFALARTTRNSLNSLSYCDNLITLAVDPGETVPDMVKVCDVSSVNADYSDINLSGMFTNNNGIRYLAGPYYQNDTYAAVDCSQITNLSNLRQLSLRPKGNINNLPLSDIFLASRASTVTGSLEEYAANRRANGKTSGYLAFGRSNTTWVVTYQNTALKDLPDSVAHRDGNNIAYFVWDADSMGFATQAPDNFVKYSNEYNATVVIRDEN